MAKAMSNGVTYYEKLVKKMNQSMAKDPRSAMVMDMNTLQIVAKGASLAALSKKMAGKPRDNTIIFQKPNEKAAWIL
jgi:hypothetical protein